MQYQPNTHTNACPTTSTTSEETGNARCDECNGRLVSNDDGELLCNDCGLIVDEYHIDPGPSYTAFSSEDWQSKSHHGGTNTVAQPLNGLGTVFYTSRDGYGRTVTSKQRSRYQRLKKHHDIYDKNRERNYENAFNELTALVSRLQLPTHVKDEAAKIYKRAFKNDLIRGRSIEGMISGSLLIAIRKHQVPRSADDLAEFGHVDEGEIFSAFKYIRSELRIPTPPPSPFLWFSELANTLDLEPGIRTEARKRLETMLESGRFCGRDPQALAVSTMYATYLYNHKEPFSQTDAADAADVGKQTISNITAAILEQDGLELCDLHPWFKNPINELNEFAERHSLPARTRAAAEDLLEAVKETDYLDDRLPKPTAMAAVAIASIKTGHVGFNEDALLEFANQTTNSLTDSIRTFIETFNITLDSITRTVIQRTSFLGAYTLARHLTASNIDILRDIGVQLRAETEFRTGVTPTPNGGTRGTTATPSQVTTPSSESAYRLKFGTNPSPTKRGAVPLRTQQVPTTPAGVFQRQAGPAPAGNENPVLSCTSGQTPIPIGSPPDSEKRHPQLRRQPPPSVPIDATGPGDQPPADTGGRQDQHPLPHAN